MKRLHRLRRPDQFQRVRRDGRTVSHPLLRLTAAPGRRRQTRCGFVVGKRFGPAVERNRARRRVREAVRLDFGHIASGMDLVFVLRSAELNQVSFALLQETVRSLLRRAGLWRDVPAAQAPARALRGEG